jgi:hypothetical protein
VPQLSFISDEALENNVSHLLKVATQAREKAESEFGRNVIDPFAVLFELSGFNASTEIWLNSEQNRQAQKSLQNHIGIFHQNILGSAPGWEDLGTGGIVDIANPERKLIAEVKNKHNTLNASGKAKIYEQLTNLVMPKGQQYKGYTAYYVEIIPKKAIRYDKPFTPSDAGSGTPKPANGLIRQIDGYSFYALATGIADALEQLFLALPDVIESCSNYAFHDRQFAIGFFKKAYSSTSK